MEQVLPALLRANLHTRQYADLVGRVLRKLAPNGGVADSDLTFLWDLAQKVQLAHTTWQSTGPAIAACHVPRAQAMCCKHRRWARGQRHAGKCQAAARQEAPPASVAGGIRKR